MCQRPLSRLIRLFRVPLLDLRPKQLGAQWGHSSATFQRMMDNILGYLSLVVVYIDGILIFSENDHDHQQHLQTVLCVLQETELVARQDKCVRSLICGIPRPCHQNKVKVITNYPNPTTIKDLKAFLGLVNFYSRFTPMASHIRAPSTKSWLVTPQASVGHGTAISI